MNPVPPILNTTLLTMVYHGFVRFLYWICWFWGPGIGSRRTLAWRKAELKARWLERAAEANLPWESRNGGAVGQVGNTQKTCGKLQKPSNHPQWELYHWVYTSISDDGKWPAKWLLGLFSHWVYYTVRPGTNDPHKKSQMHQDASHHRLIACDR